MSVGGRIFAALYDPMMSRTEKAGLGAHRQALLGGVSGRVLEIGGGTGANLDYYGDGVRTLTIIEPECTGPRTTYAPWSTAFCAIALATPGFVCVSNGV